MAQTVPLFRLVLAVLAAGGVAGYGAVLVAPRLGIEELAGTDPFISGVAGGVAALVAWLAGAVVAVVALDGVVEGLAALFLAGYAVTAVPLVPAAAVLARRRLAPGGSSAGLDRWVALSAAGFLVVGALTAGLSAVLLWIPQV